MPSGDGALARTYAATLPDAPRVRINARPPNNSTPRLSFAVLTPREIRLPFCRKDPYFAGVRSIGWGRSSVGRASRSQGVFGTWTHFLPIGPDWTTTCGEGASEDFALDPPFRNFPHFSSPA